MTEELEYLKLSGLCQRRHGLDTYFIFNVCVFFFWSGFLWYLLCAAQVHCIKMQRTRTGETDDLRNSIKWNCLLCKVLCKVKSKLKPPYPKSSVGPEPIWLRLKSNFIGFVFCAQVVKTIFNFFLLCKYRDLRESRLRFDSVGTDMKRKENQIRELQQRLENSEGCKSSFHYSKFRTCSQLLIQALTYIILSSTILW